jgi:hypothetical protein
VRHCGSTESPYEHVRPLVSPAQDPLGSAAGHPVGPVPLLVEVVVPVPEDDAVEPAPVPVAPVPPPPAPATEPPQPAPAKTAVAAAKCHVFIRST